VLPLSPLTQPVVPAEPELARRWLPTDAWVRLLLVPCLAFIALASNTAYLADFWHHLARGRVIVSQGQLLDHDVFTFTAFGQSFQDVNWLAQVVYFVLFDLGGLPLVRVVNALLVALTLAILMTICRRRSGSAVATMVVGIGVFLGLWQVLTIRPQTFSMFLFVCLFDLLDRSEHTPRFLFIPPALVAIWVNVHGAFPAGLVLVGAYLLAQAGAAWKRGWRDRRLWHLSACLAACILATLVNPYGWHIYEYVGTTSGRAAARGIDEWVPPGFGQTIGVAFFLSLAGLVVLIGLNWRRGTYRPNLLDVALAICFLPLAAGSVRMVAWWLLVMAPLAAGLFAKLLRGNEQAEYKPSLGAGLTCGALLAMAIFSVPGLASYNPLLSFRPQNRVQGDLDAVLVHLREKQAGCRVFTRFEWGEYLTWASDFPVFMDGRIEIYSDRIWKEYENVTIGRDWAKVLDDYEVDALILDSAYHARTGLLARVDESPGWQLSFESGSARVYLRNR